MHTLNTFAILSTTHRPQQAYSHSLFFRIGIHKGLTSINSHQRLTPIHKGCILTLPLLPFAKQGLIIPVSPPLRLTGSFPLTCIALLVHPSPQKVTFTGPKGGICLFSVSSSSGYCFSGTRLLYRCIKVHKRSLLRGPRVESAYLTCPKALVARSTEGPFQRGLGPSLPLRRGLGPSLPLQRGLGPSLPLQRGPRMESASPAGSKDGICLFNGV